MADARRRGWVVVDSFSDPHRDAVGAAEVSLLRKRQETGTRSQDKEIKDNLRILCFESPSALKIIETRPVDDLFALEYLPVVVGTAGCGTLTTTDRDHSVVWGKAFEPKPP
jgi:hypothetical protein